MVLYQNETLAGIGRLQDFVESVGLADGQAMACGTLGAIGAVGPAVSCAMRLSDPSLGRAIKLAYRVRLVPVFA